MPRKIIGAAFLSLDGVMQAPGGPEEDSSGGFPYGGWLAPVGDEAVGDQVGKLFDRPFDLLLGRRTYDIFAGYWPYNTDNPIGEAFERCGKYVLTRSTQSLHWANSHGLDGLDALHSLKAQDGPNLVIQGSSTLYPQLLERGLLDRLITLVAPVTLGTGKRLFGEGTPGRTFKAVEQQIGTGGCVVSVFEPAGPVESGTFATKEPSEAEMERRARVAAGSW